MNRWSLLFGRSVVAVCLLCASLFTYAQEKTDPLITAAEKLAADVAASSNDSERRAQLNTHQEQWSPQLRVALFKQGEQSRRQGDYARALSLFQLALEVAEKCKDRSGIAMTLSDIGVIHQSQGNGTLALDYYQRSLEMNQALGDKKEVAFVLNRIGVTYRAQGNYRKALEYYQQALAIDEAIGHKTGIARELTNIGVVHSYQGNYQQALAYNQRSLKLRDELNDKWGFTATIQNIGQAYEGLGDYTQALEYYKLALASAESIGLKERMASEYTTIGSALRMLGRTEEALDYYQKAIKFADEASDKGDQSYAYAEVAQSYLALGKYDAAITLAERSAVISRQSADRESLWVACTTAGRAHFALEHYDIAQKYFAEAIQTIEELREMVVGSEESAQLFFENKVAPYYSMADLLLVQKKIPEAFAFAERAKARVLLDVLRNGRSSVTKEMTTAELSRERELTRAIAELNSQITRAAQQAAKAPLAVLRTELQKARLNYEAFRTELYGKHPQLKAQRGQVQPLTLAKACELLPDAEHALIEFVMTEQRTWLFVITRKNEKSESGVDLKAYPIEIKGRELTERIDRFSRAIAEREAFKSQAQSLYELLLKPAATQLREKNSLVIVPDNALWNLPFQALQSAPDHFLLEDAAISYAPSLTALHAIRQATRDNLQNKTDAATLLALGNPVLETSAAAKTSLARRDESSGPLPEAEREVKGLGKLYGSAQSRIYIGAEAREDRVKQEAGRYRILQFATHGILDDAAPMYSHLLLSPGNEQSKEDGLFEAREIMNFDLHAEMVVLSACETARGKVGAGEGVIGLTWALFVAGSPTTVVSQWKVSSASTADLMLEFHRQVLANNPAPVSKARALQQASLKLLKTGRYKHPFYWAGFVIVGNGN